VFTPQAPFTQTRIISPKQKKLNATAKNLKIAKSPKWQFACLHKKLHPKMQKSFFPLPTVEKNNTFAFFINIVHIPVISCNFG